MTEEEWQDRLPVSTVPSARLGAEAERLQAGAPLPAGTPRGGFASPPVARDRINLANDIYRYSLCAWVRDWIAADAAGDAARAEAAVVALEGAKAWQVVAEAIPSGDVPCLSIGLGPWRSKCELATSLPYRTTSGLPAAEGGPGPCPPFERPTRQMGRSARRSNPPNTGRDGERGDRCNPAHPFQPSRSRDGSHLAGIR